MQEFKLWENTPGNTDFIPVIEYYGAENKKTDSTVVIFPGGGYYVRAEHEGKGYAQYLNSIGMDAFVVQYRVHPNVFPTELADARRSIKWVRANAEKFGINPNKICVMGSSAGGHLAAMVSTYDGEIEGEINFENNDEIDKMSYKPNYQILCYPVVNISDLSITHTGSVTGLLGEQLQWAAYLDPALIANENTPPAFIWHTSDDNAVNVSNSLKYGEKLRACHIPFEMHIFPNGPHGMGLAEGNEYVSQWSGMLKSWLKYNDLI